MALSRRRMLVAPCAVMILPSASHAQAARPLLLPSAVVLYVHDRLDAPGYVEALAARLGALLAAPVIVRRTGFDYADAPSRPAPSPVIGPQREGFAMLERFNAVHGGDAPAGAFHFLLVPDDLWRDPFRFLFSFSYGDETTAAHLSVVSLARLADTDAGAPKAARTLRTGGRLFRLIAKNVARMAGFAGDGCIMGFARSVEELDRIPTLFCENDAAALRAAGLLAR